MTIPKQLETWKSLALAYEVFIESAADCDTAGMSAGLKAASEARSKLVDADLLEEGNK